MSKGIYSRKSEACIKQFANPKPFSEEHKRKIGEARKKLIKEGKLIPYNKGKTYEEIYGIEKAKELKEKKSLLKSKSYEEQYGIERANNIRNKISESNKGKIGVSPPWTGTKRPKEIGLKITEGKKKSYAEGKTKKYWLGKKKPIESIKKQSETQKRLRKEGKIKNWNLGLTKETDERLDKLSKKVSGENNSFYGKHHNEITINSISNKIIKQYENGRRVWNDGLNKENNEGCKRISESMKGNQNFLGKKHTKESILKNSEKHKKLFKDENFVKRWIKSHSIKPTKPEIKLNRLLKNNNFFYKYVGNYKFWINGYNPDFINCNGQKKIIEMFGDYWHNLPKQKLKDEVKLKIYNQYGYQTLIIWEHELKDLKKVLEKVTQFDKQ